MPLTFYIRNIGARGVASEEMFDKHLRTLMDAYGHEKILGEVDQKLLVNPLIDHDALMSQHGLFKAYIKFKF